MLQELHNSLYFARRRITQLFDFGGTYSGPSTGFYSELAAANNIVLVTSLFEKRAPGLYHNTAVVLNVTVALPGNTARCTSLMIRPIMRSFISLLEIWDLNHPNVFGKLGFGLLGPVVSWAARLMALKGAELLIYPTAIGWGSSDIDDESPPTECLDNLTTRDMP